MIISYIHVVEIESSMLRDKFSLTIFGCDFKHATVHLYMGVAIVL